MEMSEFQSAKEMSVYGRYPTSICETTPFRAVAQISAGYAMRITSVWCFLSVSNPPIKREPSSTGIITLLVEVEHQHNRLQESRRMMGNQKGFSTVALFAIVALLSYCSPASSYAFLPRVSRTNDAVIIDFAGVGYAPSYYGKTLYGQIANPGFVPVPSVYGWTLPFGYPSFISPSTKQIDAEYGEYFGEELTVKQTPPKCGSGPATMPASRALATERVVGGDAKKNAWPFVVALKKADGLFCTGTLLSDTKVLLAAQCLEKMSLYELSAVTVLVGLHSSDYSDLQMTRRISKVVLHSKYNAFTYANDIAIITLDAPVILSRSVATACLPLASTDPDQFVEQDAVVLGWGASTDDGKPAGKLQQAKTAILANGDCKLDATVGKYVSDNTVCTTLDKAFTCVIDVGGPVVTLPTPGTWTVVGINSYTKDCKSSNGIKTRVAAFRTWIDQYMV